MSDPTRSSFYLPAQDASEADVPGVKKKSFSKKMAKSFKVKELMTPRGSSLSGDLSPAPSAKSVEGTSNSSTMRAILGRTSSGPKKAAAQSNGPSNGAAGGEGPKAAPIATAKSAGSGLLGEPSLEWSSGFSGRYQPSKKTAPAAPSAKAGAEVSEQAKTPAQPASPVKAEPAPAPPPPAPVQLPAAPAIAVTQPECKEEVQVTIRAGPVEGKPSPALASTNVKVEVRTDPTVRDASAKPVKAALAPSPVPAAATVVETQAPAVRPGTVATARPKQARRESGLGGALRGLVWLGAATAIGVLAAKQAPALRRTPASKRE
ncbi:hypothetical protein F751_4481 [Auxenochlorella protothecoides]|uniref:Uncharacterized protein n=1 Tax=Auxenochlorella protothecoides TaxID=3075 RepID=A0A087SNA7_AUXPR|nr:hypothetical protein F751_4481 [Auxenochlorella protothecoides]KFM27211.1 hypothetical protein F751_4481 [Auxenochlorella protothecoides]RMZ57011.1 hypothetical protein APUTEX25_002243 [Auxenochlorella protothecoides]|eukprot:RMZ57011.1 hypothetical protein APUTEX25_002243 [Auxenochlorella protothecoides]